MDPNLNIYRDLADKIPEADKARLDGFLAGRAEADADAHQEHLRTEMEKLKAELEAAEAKRDASPEGRGDE